MTGRDETFLPELGLQKRVIFCVIPDNDETYNFLITMLYTQIFDQLFRLADSTPEYKGALPVHVRLQRIEGASNFVYSRLACYYFSLYPRSVLVNSCR